MELPSPMYLGSGGSDTSHFGYCNDPSLNGGPSLQEMIDSDMKADFDDVLTGNSLNFQVRIFFSICAEKFYLTNIYLCKL